MILAESSLRCSLSKCENNEAKQGIAEVFLVIQFSDLRIKSETLTFGKSNANVYRFAFGILIFFCLLDSRLLDY